MMKSDLVGRLTPDELPVYVARVPAGSVLRNAAASDTDALHLLFAPGLYRNDIAHQFAQARFGVRRRDLLAAHEHDFHHLLSQMSPPFEDLTNAFIACPR